MIQTLTLKSDYKVSSPKEDSLNSTSIIRLFQRRLLIWTVQYKHEIEFDRGAMGVVPWAE